MEIRIKIFFVQNQILLSILTLCLCVQVVLSGSQSHSVSVCEFRPQSASVLLHLSGLHRARPVLLHPQMSVLPCELVPQGLCAGTLCVPLTLLTFSHTDGSTSDCRLTASCLNEK